MHARAPGTNVRILHGVNPLVGSLLPRAERPFGDYELISKLATGGMAEIFLARHKDAAKSELVVIKRVLPRLLEEERFIAMFRDEGRLAAQIIHPNVCRVNDLGTVDNKYYIAMEYLHGIPLSRALIRAARTKKPLDVEVVVGIVMQCAEGLHHAHELVSKDGQPLDVVHRDVSPPNILITAEGVVKMLDFGVAKARGATQKTRTGTVKGKNSYMSPEQILGEVVDRRSDVFSLGIVLWEALASKRLFNKETDFLTFKAITKAEIPDVQNLRSDVSDALASVLNKALALTREERYATAKEFGDALADALGGAQAGDEAIGGYIREVFSKDLADRLALTRNITKELAAVGIDEALESESEASEGRPPGPSQPVAQSAVELALATGGKAPPEAGLESAPANAVGQDAGAVGRRIVLALVIAGLVAAAAVLLLS